MARIVHKASLRSGVKEIHVVKKLEKVMATNGTKIVTKPIEGVTRKTKETKFGAKKGSTSPGLHTNSLKVR